MKFSQILLACGLIFTSAITVHSDTIPVNDPKIIIGRGGDSTPITTLEFRIPVNANGGGITDFDNATGKDWSGLLLTVRFPNAKAAMAAGVSCRDGDIVFMSLFRACSAVRHGNILMITLTHGLVTFCSTTPWTPCPVSSDFFVDLNDPNVNGHNGKGGWKHDLIEARAITGTVVPEPNIFLLQLSGLAFLGGVWARQRLTKSSNQFATANIVSAELEIHHHA